MTHADLVLRNGNVLTLDRASRIASAVAVQGDRIAAVGGDAELASWIGPATRTIDLAGRTLMPGLTDGHAHLDREGLKALLPSVSSCRSIRELVERLRAIAATTPPGTWIVTMPVGEPPEYRWNESMFEEGRLPNRHDLDAASSSHPILIRCAWGYWSGELPLVSFANSAALELAGVKRGMASPSPLVTIELDAHGDPTGRFFENAYQPIVEFTLFRLAPHFSADDRLRTLAASMRAYNELGTTSVFEGHGAAPEVIDAYRQLRAQGRQTVRANLTFSPGWSGATQSDVDAWVREHAAKLRGRGEGDDWVRLEGLFAEPDVAPNESRLRAQCAPRTGWAGFHYDCGLPRDLLIRLLQAAARERLRVCGIQAGMIELYEAAAKAAPINDLRWVMAHPITLDAQQIARVRDLGVVITTHTNGYIWKRGADLARQLGDKADTVVPVRALLDAGITVSLATDNVPVSLWHCIWHVTERISREGVPVGSDQRVSREQALHCATTHGARLCLAEDERGTIEPGRLADLIVLPENPLTTSADRLKAMQPELTIAGGRVVFERSGDKTADP